MEERREREGEEREGEEVRGRGEMEGEEREGEEREGGRGEGEEVRGEKRERIIELEDQNLSLRRRQTSESSLVTRVNLLVLLCSSSYFTRVNQFCF